MEICSAPGYSGCFNPDAIRTRCQGRSVWKPSFLRDCDLGEQPVESCWLEDFSDQKSPGFFLTLRWLLRCVCSLVLFLKRMAATKSISCCIFLLGDLPLPLAIWVCDGISKFSGWKLQVMETPSSESPFACHFQVKPCYPPVNKHSWLEIPIFNRKYIFKWWIFHGYVRLPEGKLWGGYPEATGSTCLTTAAVAQGAGTRWIQLFEHGLSTQSWGFFGCDKLQHLSTA